MNKSALICGVSGQDGALLAKLLLSKGYKVVGTSRDAQVSSFSNLTRLGIKDDIDLVSMSLSDFRSVLQVVNQVKPDEIYNFAGQSSVGLSFEQPVETLESYATGMLNLLEVVRFLSEDVKIYNASSGECFGDAGHLAAVEGTPFSPRSPYAVAKAAAFWESVVYREAYGLHVCSGILFNHESPLRPSRFVTQKVIEATCRIANGSKEALKLGNISIRRDWGWAEEYVDAMWRMLQQEVAEDYVIATGASASLKDFVEVAFNYVNLDWREHVISDESLLRPSEILENKGNATKAKEILGWQASYHMQEVVHGMMDAVLNKQ